ncbi:MAG: SEC-C motif-containing protein [Flavobacteriaceae bacterium]|jgi:SEC-C motif-containing protein
MMNNRLSKLCPCGLVKPYVECCGTAHQHIASAETCEALMRSRYTAFVQANGDYLMVSHHSMTRRMVNKSELIQWSQSVEWQKLEILKIVGGQKKDTEGIVEFKAHFKVGGKGEFIHEESKFVREFGHWVYFGVVQ